MLFNWLKSLFTSIFKIFSANNAVKTDTPSAQSALNLNGNTANSDDLEIPFYPKLIDHLEKDHQNLLRLYTEINENLKSNSYLPIPMQLLTFKEEFKSHLETENIKFYGYLEQRLKDQSQEFLSLRRFRKEMRSIERTVIKFLDQWIEDGVSKNTLGEFKVQYEAIGAALIKRIESEEIDLYTLYNQL